jgi:biotin transport system substrate-specific component
MGELRVRNQSLRNMLLASLFAALTAVIAQVSFFLPGVPNVPVTLQVLAVCLAGGLLGPAWGAIAMGLYVLLGAVGLPVYANGASGLHVLVGPTGGYLLSYPAAAFAIGLLARPQRAPGLLRTGLAMVAGLAMIYLGGGGWAVLVGGKGLAVVLSGWVLPFIPFDLGKVVLAAVLAGAVNRALVAQGFWRGRAV